MKVESNASKLIKSNHENKQRNKLLKIKTKETVEKINSDINERKESANESLDEHETGELLIKNNKRKHYDNHGLRIASVGNEPILKIDTSKKKPAVNLSAANLRRLQSLNTLKKSYQNQKLLIQTALSKVDNSPKNKIIFEDNVDSETTENSIQKKKPKKNLFDNQSEDEEFEVNFDIKEQFQSKEGQKLLELQSKYKNDKRFVLDSRFLDNNEIGDNEVDNEENDENSLEAEKEKEYEILEQVLGKKVSKSLHKNEFESQKKAMLRFDPTQPEHLKFEIKEEVKKKKKRKSHDDEVKVLSKKITEKKELPTVSKETFYKVTDNLKESLHKKQDFSLLNMFGKADERDEDKDTEQFSKNLSTNSITRQTNPFKYDSSDDEDETGHIPDKNVLETEKSLENIEAKVNSRIHWTEPFFFKHDDYRLQEGFDFIEKMRSEENTDFSKLRRNLKEIVRAKVRNVQRKHKPFKKKLGGNKRRKMLRMKKALKR